MVVFFSFIWLLEKWIRCATPEKALSTSSSVTQSPSLSECELSMSTTMQSAPRNPSLERFPPRNDEPT